MVLLAAPGCGGDGGFGRDDAVARVRQDNPGITADQAGCVADRLVGRFGLDELGTLAAADPADADLQEAEFTDAFRCGVEGDVRQEIVSQLTANALPADQAGCVADELVPGLTDADIDVIVSGEISESFTQKFDTAMRDCGAAPS
ncbi:MAG: hypothetical protein OEW29_01595 [Acidimicrobiia bacterium]|nr:hypothetical protein [Acidimicrobiia bacterium]